MTHASKLPQRPRTSQGLIEKHCVLPGPLFGGILEDLHLLLVLFSVFFAMILISTLGELAYRLCGLSHTPLALALWCRAGLPTLRSLDNLEFGHIGLALAAALRRVVMTP